MRKINKKIYNFRQITFLISLLVGKNNISFLLFNNIGLLLFLHILIFLSTKFEIAKKKILKNKLINKSISNFLSIFFSKVARL